MDEILRFTQLAFKALALVDQGYSLDIDETRQHAAEGTLLDWLEEEFPGRIDFVLYTNADKTELSDRFALLAKQPAADLGVEHNGLALVAGYSLEAIQEDRQSGPHE